MPTWVILYFITYTGFTAWSIADDIRCKKEPMWFSVSEVLGDACLVVVALSYWLVQVQHALIGATLVIFASGLAMLLGQAGRAFYRNVLSDPELSIGGKFFVGATGSGLMIVISAPLVLWGFNVAVLGTSNGN